jgi:alpha-tubulin suppressor-like RCC1 family protein
MKFFKNFTYLFASLFFLSTCFLQAANDLEFIAITARSRHSLAIDIDGNVWTRGDNRSGQLGNGTDNDSDFPVKVKTN